MKRRTIGFGASILSLVAIACGTKETPARSDTAQPAPTPAVSANTATPADSAAATGATASPTAASSGAKTHRDSAASSASRTASSKASAKAPTPKSMDSAHAAHAATAAAKAGAIGAPKRDSTRNSSAATASGSTTARRDTAAAPAASPAAPSEVGQGGDNLSVTQAQYNGWKTFAVNCTRCHGEDAVGSSIAPSLVHSLREKVNHELFIQTVTNGRPEKGMPTWGPLLSQEKIEELYVYLKARSNGTLAPGRPHVKGSK